MIRLAPLSTIATDNFIVVQTCFHKQFSGTCNWVLLWMQLR